MKRCFFLTGWTGVLVGVGGFCGGFDDAGAAPRAVKSETRTAPAVVSVGPHWRTWQSTVRTVLSDGRVVERKEGYVEAAVGLHFLKNGIWTPAEERFEVFANGLIARNGQIQVILAPNATAAGLVDMTSADGRRFSSHILGLAYTDMSTGQSVLVSEPKDSVAELLAENVVVYRDSMAGPARCDIRYTYTRAGLEQDLVIREQLPSPEEYGLNPAFCRIEVWTEFLESPEPTRKQAFLKEASAVRGPVLDPEMSDLTLVFGTTEIGPGRAFLLGDETEGKAVDVGKDWVELNQRKFLIEKVDYQDLRGHLLTLPQAAIRPPGANDPNAGQVRVRQPSRAAALASIPKRERREARAVQPPVEIKTAAVRSGEPGLVIDYQSFTTDTNDFVFRSDTTYYISGIYNLSGTTVLEGLSVLKFTNGTTTTKLKITGPLECRTSLYRPAIFTSWSDDTAGERINGSSGAPSTTAWHGFYLDISGNTNVIDLHDVRMRHAYFAVNMNSSSQLILRNAQFSTNFASIVGGNSRLRNVLIHNGDTAIGSGTHSGENVTVHRVRALRSGSITTPLTNCLVLAVTNNVLISGVNNVSNLISDGYFQTVGNATHLLANGSPHRNAGTTNIDAGLLQMLRLQTTEPPLTLTGDITTDTVLFPRVRRDRDQVDCGYHHPAADYVMSGVCVTNATLTINPGTVVGVYGGSNTFGLQLKEGAHLVATGTPAQPVRFVRHDLFQEHGLATWSTTNHGRAITTPFPAPTSWSARFRFTEWMTPANGPVQLYADWGSDYESSRVEFRDCQVYGGGLWLESPTATLTNCLLDRLPFTVLSAASQTHNTLFRGGNVAIDGTYGAHTVGNCLFDRTAIDAAYFGTTNYFNGYLSGEDKLSPTNMSVVILTSIQYETNRYADGEIAWHYYPTNGGAGSLSSLIDAGSTNAHLLTLRHFTVSTNQTVEGTSIVEPGFHYVGIDANGGVLDTDGDGFFDYFENWDGDDTVGSGETDWQAYNSPFGIGPGPGLVVFTPLK